LAFHVHIEKRGREEREGGGNVLGEAQKKWGPFLSAPNVTIWKSGTPKLLLRDHSHCFNIALSALAITLMAQYYGNFGSFQKVVFRNNSTDGMELSSDSMPAGILSVRSRSRMTDSQQNLEP
jgi:hypothetical protein